MYRDYYGLQERPFDLTPDPRFLYLTPMHREALAAVQYAITARRGIAVVVGEAGTGKTTIVRAALRALKGQKVRHTYLNNPTLTRGEFLQFLTRAYRLSAGAVDSKVTVISELTAKLARYHAADTAAVLVVDEAQSLPYELLEEIRLLANIETSTAKLLQVVLVGQPELGVRLNEASLRQLKQRVAIRAQLSPLDLRATSAFIAGRLRVAGGQPAAIFTPRAIEAVFAYSGGIPRTINVICDNALLAGFATDTRPIGPAVIDEVARDFDLVAQADSGLPELSAPAPPPAAAALAGAATRSLWPRPAPAPAPPPEPAPVTAPSAAPEFPPEHPPTAAEPLPAERPAEVRPTPPSRELFSGFAGRRPWFTSKP